MDQTKVIDLAKLVGSGQCYLHHELDRIEGLIPSPAPSNHAPHLAELDNGDLLCVWFGGSDEGAGDIKIYLSRLDADSARWSEPVRLSDDFSRAEQNPALFRTPDGELWLTHTSMETRGCTLEEWQEKLRKKEASGPYAMQHTSVVVRRISRDNGRTWEPAHIWIDKPGSFCRHPVTVTQNGNWLFPVWRSTLDETRQFGHDKSSVYVSKDRGATWTEVEIPGSQGRVHPSIVETDSGKLVAFFRSRNADRIYRSESPDGGESWTVPERTDLPNNNASIHAAKLKSGAIAIVFNQCHANDDPNVVVWPYERYPVTVALSDDDGVTWPYMRIVEPGDQYAGEQNKKFNRRYEYPSILQTKDGMIHIAYAYGNRTHIKYVSFSEDWIRGTEKIKWPWDNFPMQ